MKKYFLLIILSFGFRLPATAQIVSITCYHQNDSIAQNVNNLLINGGLEYGCPDFGYFCPNAPFYSCDLTGWTCLNGGHFTYCATINGTLYKVVQGTKAAYFGNGHCAACSYNENDTSCIINTGCTVQGVPPGYPVNDTAHGGTNGVSLEQTVSGLVVGNTYVLEFWAGGEAIDTTTYITDGLFAVDVGFGDTMFRCRPTLPIIGVGTEFVIEFIATSTSHTIKFTNWGHMGSSFGTHCTELVLDNVRLYTSDELPDGFNNDNEPAFINVYPNPVTDRLIVKTKAGEQAEIILYDIASRKLLQENFIGSISLNTQDLPKGIYIYEVRNKSGVIKEGKVVKE